METYIAGIPCHIDYTISGQYVPAKTNAPPEHCYPEEHPEVEFIVCDRRGRPAPWLEKKMTEQDSNRIELEILHAASQYAD